MIQRRQSIFLVLAAATLAFFLGAPIASYTDSEEVRHLLRVGPMEIKYWIAVLSILIGLVDIFYYNSLRAQLNICYTNCMLILIVAVMVTYELFMINSNNVQSFEIHFGAFLPTVALIFELLAARGIANDINVLKNSDRLR